MSEKFKSFYLVCLDHGDDINYVVARNPSLKEARSIASDAKKKWPEQKVYITLEKVPVENPFGQIDSLDLEYSYTKKKNPVNDRCVCGSEYGECVGELSCRCNPLAKCKRVDKVTEKPLPFQEDTIAPRRKKPKLTPATLEVVKVYRGVAEVKIPEWAPDEIFGITYEEIPGNLHSKLKEGNSFQVLASLQVEDPDEMVIEFMQTNPDEDEEDEFEDLDEEEDEAEDDDSEEAEEDDLEDSEDSDDFDEEFDEDENEEDYDDSSEQDDEDFEEADEEDEYQDNPEPETEEK